MSTLFSATQIFYLNKLLVRFVQHSQSVGESKTTRFCINIKALTSLDAANFSLHSCTMVHYILAAPWHVMPHGRAVKWHLRQHICNSHIYMYFQRFPTAKCHDLRYAFSACNCAE